MTTRPHDRARALAGPQPGCVNGEGACPPEDCGGVGGYAELLEALADPHHHEHEQMRQWAGSLPEFERERTDRDVRDTAGAVPASVRLVLDLAGDGVKLTPGGRLTRAFVRLVQQHRPAWEFWDKPASVEEDLLPLLRTHELLRTVGLLRLRSGVVRPIRAAADDLEVIRRLRRGYNDETFEGSVVGAAIGWLAANGPATVPELSAVAFDMLGRSWMAGDRAVTADHVETTLRVESSLLVALDLITPGQYGEHWGPGPSARSLFPRATGLAAYFDYMRRRFPAGAGALQ